MPTFDSFSLLFLHTPPLFTPLQHTTKNQQPWVCQSQSCSRTSSARRRCASSWSAWTPPVKLPSSTSSSSERSLPPFPPSVSTPYPLHHHLVHHLFFYFCALKGHPTPPLLFILSFFFFCHSCAHNCIQLSFVTLASFFFFTVTLHPCESFLLSLLLWRMRGPLLERWWQDNKRRPALQDTRTYMFRHQ